MIVDSSAILAILFHEPDAKRFEDAMSVNSPCRMPTVGFLEVAMVLEGRGGAVAGDQLDILLERASVELVPHERGRRAARVAALRRAISRR